MTTGKMIIKILLLSVLAGVITAVDPLITLPNGQIRGHELKGENTYYFAYQEIPYASPPVGSLRFKEPVAAEDWEGVLNATENTKICYQPGATHLRQSEDCLYLNVYTPREPGKNASELLPVLFWIHGGAFVTGDGTYQFYGPGFWMDYNIVVVTINYRLGPFGFLTTEDGVIPGNLGLKDQVLALEWVNQNIHLFGGDSAKITITGESAGATSVGYLLISQATSGLFRGAIIQSGSAICYWGHQNFARHYAYRMGSELDPNFTTDKTSEELLQLLQKVSADDIISANVTVEYGDQQIWLPVIEDENLENALVVGPMEENMEVGNFNKVPTLIGFNSEEYLTFLRKASNVTEQLKLQGMYFDSSLSTLIGYHFNMTAEDYVKASSELKEIYTDGLFQDDLSALVKYMSDETFTTPVIRHAALQSNYTDVFLYQFSYSGVMSDAMFDVLGGHKVVVEGTDNVGHAEELIYMWDFHVVNLTEVPDSDLLVHKQLLTLWTNFVKYLDPITDDDQVLTNVVWPKVSPDNITYLNINVTLDIATNPKKYKEWKAIIDTYAIPPLPNY